MSSPLALLPLFVPLALVPQPSNTVVLQASEGSRLRTIETTYSSRLKHIRVVHSYSVFEEPIVEERFDWKDIVVASTVCFRDSPAPPLREAPQGDAAAFFRTVDLARRIKSISGPASWYPATGEGPWSRVDRFVSPLVNHTIDIHPTPGDAELFWVPQPDLLLRQALEASLVDARLPGLVAFLDGDIGCKKIAPEHLAVVPELAAMGGVALTPHDGARSDLSSLAFYSWDWHDRYWNQIQWEPITRTVTCVVAPNGRTIQRVIETPLIGTLALERRRDRVQIPIQMGYRTAISEMVETAAMGLRGTLRLTVDMHSGEAVALCLDLDLDCNIELAFDAPDIDYTLRLHEEWEGTASMRFTSVSF